MEETLQEEWNKVLSRFSERFGEEMDIDGILFLIGVNELGQGRRKFTKDQKLDVMHIAICKLLSYYGYYELEGLDEEGWPHWKMTEKLPQLKAGQQQRLVKEAIIEYVREVGFLD